ncbi:MAG TPA: 1,4-beta-glucanase [Microbacterium sp.]|nr:1,4-beta-glucanase [Microbacterium sp.]
MPRPDSRWSLDRLTPKERRQLRVVGVVAGIVLIAFATLAVIGLTRGGFGALTPAITIPSPTPRAAMLYISPQANAVIAAQTDDRFGELATTPQARWLSSWSTVETARWDAAQYLDPARQAGQVPVLVLYQIPDRDCGLYAQGGLESDTAYLEWVDEVAASLDGFTDAMVIIEPDALPMAGDCQSVDVRTTLLSQVVDRLAPTGAQIYLDAGHSGWVDAAEMADRLVASGVDRIRGFSTNVSNFRATSDELQYAERLRAELIERGVDDTHYVIDTSRNGAPVSNGDVCNPPDARIGERPQLYEGTALDAVLWIKAPGESDGPCHGGPQIGWWPDGALQLLGREQ